MVIYWNVIVTKPFCHAFPRREVERRASFRISAPGICFFSDCRGDLPELHVPKCPNPLQPEIILHQHQLAEMSQMQMSELVFYLVVNVVFHNGFKTVL